MAPARRTLNSDLSTLAGTFWRLDHTSGAVSERTSIAALVRREIFARIVVRISRETIDFSAPGGVVRGYVFRHDSGRLEIGRTAFGRGSFKFANGFVLDAIEADLPRVASYIMKGDVLELLDSHAHPVLALAPITTIGLENREWSIDQYFDGAKLVTAPPVAQITFMNGGVDGGTGCCGLGGTYNLSGTHLQLSNLFCFSGGWCPAEYELHTTPILHALQGERIVEPDGRRMILRDDRGTVQIVLRPLDR
jgi:heat shock protein HslJ